MSEDLLARFQEAVRRDPGRIAVRDTAAKLSFAELDRRTATLAGALRSRGIGRGDRVGVSLGRSVDLVVALLAVWRTGAAYVPLDPGYPAGRLAYMAEDSGISVLLATGTPTWLPSTVDVLAPDAEATAAEDIAVSALDPAYVIYTSGSTGKPKGVQAHRGAVASLVTALERVGMYAPCQRVVAWNASMSFDASVQQWARVCRGDTVIVLDQEHRTDPARLVDWLDECAVTDLDLTPSHWTVLREHLLPGSADGRVLRLFVGGEPIAEPVWHELAAASADGNLEALNLYGPTECTVDATATWITEVGGPHIGTPLPGIRAHVLDESLRPVQNGELYLSGPRLAAGYLDRPGLTAQRFVADPFGEPGTRLYRTGDQVRWSPEGVLEFTGRVDRQVKLRGYRVELGEIESVLRRCPGVTAAAVLLRDDETIGQRLVAYYVAADDTVRDAAAEALPEFMIPAEFVKIDALPLTPNGKLDTAALPAPEATAVGVEPSGEVEELIAGVWSEVLGRDRISADDDFFALGGHSLVALRVVARLKKNFGVPVSTKDVYRHPRLSDLARHVSVLAAG
ncbi:non-ribosomal peptide synthetase [Amycolatopsis sp. H20-H5]|uniref:non-ribosomal peptide synthetase n=1 Tax=Amycolatopsis sp. H20-H5 TaxID=3046309 RepID=UPI002DBC64ED|nr:non-ribosomal peptide synthetase [Amycolatopsis sp. H20-H5]MEC3978306.1 non-ribosomal peptide synthetase [Amycolatopsis sp. H20-H5]